MFDSVVDAVSPKRARLAAPAAALAHAVAFSAFIVAALWNAAQLPLPELPARDLVFPIALGIPPSGGGHGGEGRRPSPVVSSRPPAVKTAAFPSRLPDSIAALSGPELPPGDGSQATFEGDGPTGFGERDTGFGDCPGCPAGTPIGSDEGVVDASVVAPLLLYRVEPVYPESLRKLHQEGRVVVEAIIGKEGGIENMRVVSSTHALFEESALRAVGQWRYQPCRVAGRLVFVRLTVTVQFRLN